MHIPGCLTTEIELLDLDQALEAALVYCRGQLQAHPLCLRKGSILDAFDVGSYCAGSWTP